MSGEELGLDKLDVALYEMGEREARDRLQVENARWNQSFSFDCPRRNRKENSDKIRNWLVAMVVLSAPPSTQRGLSTRRYGRRPGLIGDLTGECGTHTVSAVPPRRPASAGGSFAVLFKKTFAIHIALILPSEPSRSAHGKPNFSFANVVAIARACTRPPLSYFHVPPFVFAVLFFSASASSASAID